MNFIKPVLLIALLLLSSGTSALGQENILLIPEDGRDDEALVVNSAEYSSKSTSEEIEKDKALLKGDDFSLERFAQEHLNIEGQVSASLMLLEARGAVGVRTFDDYLELGADASVMLVAAGADGALIPQVGTYIKVRLTPQKTNTVYFRGRLYKAWGLDEGTEAKMEYGIGYEMDRGQAFIELTVKEFERENDSNMYLPFIGFGMKFGGERPNSKEDEALLFD